MKEMICFVMVVFYLLLNKSFVLADEICYLRGIEKMDSEFYWPLGKSDIDQGCGQWLSKSWDGGCYNKSSSGSDQYHVGVDMKIPLGSTVYPISNGEIFYISQNGWGTGNIGVLVRHWDADGIPFLALYGHVKLFKKSNGKLLSTGDRVWGGVPFAEIGNWSPPHLHFGIFPDVSVPARWGILPKSSWSSGGGAVDPIDFLKNQRHSDTGINYLVWQECVIEGSTLCNDVPEQKVLGIMIKNPNISYEYRETLLYLFDNIDDIVENSGTWYWDGIYIPATDGSSESGDPDFVVREVFINHHKKVLRPHEDIEIFTRIKNKGDDDTSKDIGLKYWRSDGEHIDSKDDRVNLGTDNIRGENLLPGESKWESKHTEAPSTPGKYNYTVEVDYDDEIDEVHESNNKFDPPFVFEVKKPQLFLSSFFIVGETSLDPGNIFQLKAFTDNDGATPGPDVKLYYYLDGVKIGEDNMRDYNLEPEDPPKEESIYIVAPQTPGQHIVAVRVDPSDNVDEGNENDNYAEIIFTVNELYAEEINNISAPVGFQIIVQ